MYHYTYLITNTQEEKHYIGARSCKCAPTDDLGTKYFSSSRNKEFQQDQKQNSQHYQYQVLDCFESRKEAFEMEISLHKYFDVGRNSRFYNQAKQTSTGFDPYGTKQSPELRKSKSDKFKGRIFSDEHRKKISDAKKLQIVSQETREKMSRVLTGRKLSDEHKQNISKGMIGCYRSPDVGKHISEAKKGKTTFTPEHRAKISAALKARKAKTS